MTDLWLTFLTLPWWKKALLALPLPLLLVAGYFLVRSLWGRASDTIVGREYLKDVVDTYLDDNDTQIDDMLGKAEDLDKEVEAADERIEDATDQLASDMDCIDRADSAEDLMECHRRITGRAGPRSG